MIKRLGDLGRLNPRQQFALLAVTAACSVSMYLLASALIFRIGFPLDDAWIHQTYARNLALLGEWAFTPGESSAGSTAPLWSLLLAVGHFFRLGPYLWTYLLGWLCLVGLAWQGRNLFLTFYPNRPDWALWAALLITMEFHMVWAAVSGMETLLFAGLILTVLAEVSLPQPRWVRVGLLAGLSVWVRPDGITLLGPALWVLILMRQNWRKSWRAAQALGIGVGTLLVLYMFFNLKLTGNWLPNTFFAKQVEYAVLRELPLTQRWADQAMMLLVGVGAALLPGLILFILQALRRKRWEALGGVLWLLGIVSVYAVRLPVVYQHGRYTMPAMPVYLIYSLIGMAGWLEFKTPVMWKRALSKAWVLATGLVLLVFLGLGGRSYTQDVAIIESEMVTTARWVAQNTDPQALVAAHDIGALGYFSQRRLLDLAGLVSPEVIPFIRDETRLEGYLMEKQADYLVTFPDWYPGLMQSGLVHSGRLVFTTQGEFILAAGKENMVVYALK